MAWGFNVAAYSRSSKLFEVLLKSKSTLCITEFPRKVEVHYYSSKAGIVEVVMLEGWKGS